MYKTSCNDEAIIRVVGKLSLEISALGDFQEQLKVKRILEEVLYDYEVTTKETGLIIGDMEEKARIYIGCKKLDGLSRKTTYNYELILSNFSGFLRKPVSSITTMDIRMYLAMYGEGKKASTVNTQISALKSFFSWLQNEEYIVKNPMSKIKQTKTPKRVRHPLTQKEIELLKQACINVRESCIIEFFVSTGCRLSETVDVNIEDICWNERSLHVIGKGDKERKVYFSTRAEILLGKYLKNRTDNNPSLFVTSKRPYSRLGGRSIEREIKKIAKRAGLEKSIYPHIFRHTYASHNINSGMSLPVLQHLMGHENSGTTMIYAQISEENVKHEYRKIS